MATLNGNILPPPTWDPYATPGAPGTAPPPALLPADPGYQMTFPTLNVAGMQRFIQDVRFDYHYFAALGNNPLGINDAELSTTLALPFLNNPQTPLLITPGFAIHFWSGPQANSTPPADMPAETYDAYLDAAWNPQVNEFFGGELSARVGVYSDFQTFDTHSVRLTGTGLAVLSLTPNFKLKAGIWYLDRVEYKLLPSGGVVWTPNNDVRFDILFPNPKYTQRIANTGNAEWWWYLSGDYGGGSWTIKRGDEPGSPVAGTFDQVDYNDIRIALGFEFKPITTGMSGLFEVGGAFDRELVYASGSPSVYRPTTTIFLRGVLAY